MNKSSVLLLFVTLVCALSHVSAAHASLRALTQVPSESLTVTTKIPSKKKIGKQLRFFTTKLKRRAVGRTLKKPGSLQVAEAKRNMLNSKSHDEDVPSVDSGKDVETVDDSMSLASGIILPTSSESPCEAVPYCVDTETVSTANGAGIGRTDTTLPNPRMRLHIGTLRPSQQQGIDHAVEVFMSSFLCLCFRNYLPFWCRLTQVVLGERALIFCSGSSSTQCTQLSLRVTMQLQNIASVLCICNNEPPSL